MGVLSPGGDGGVMTSLLVEIIKINVGGWLAGWVLGGWLAGSLSDYSATSWPILQADTCQIFSKAKDIKMDRVWQYEPFENRHFNSI